MWCMQMWCRCRSNQVEKVTIHPFWLGLIFSGIGSLVGVVWYQLNARIKSKADQAIVDEHSIRIKKVEDWKVDKGFCKTNNALHNEKFDNINRRITESIETNSREHASLGDGIEKIDNSVDDVHVILAKMNECMIKLANNKEC